MLFAGITVIIALAGLAVAGIPFLTTMGLAASVAVAVAVLVALTLTPALLGFAGARLTPGRRKARAAAKRKVNAQPGPEDPAVTAVARRHGATPAQVRLAWALALGDHVLVIPGTGDLGHLEENVAAAALRLTDDDLQALVSVSEAAG